MDARKRTALALLLLGMAGALAVGCGKRADSVTLAGSTAFQPFAQTLARQYQTRNPGVKISVQGGGSAVGIQSSLMGTAQIGMADLVKLPDECRNLDAVVAARDGIAIIVHPSCAVTNLTLDQIRGVFTGAIANWKALGGPDAPITVVSREAGSGTRTSLEQIVGGMKLSPGAIVQSSGGTVGETVANDARAIGYLSHGMVNAKIRAVSVDGKDCTAENILTGAYPLARPIYLLTGRNPAPATREFLAFILSEPGQAQIRKDGLIPAK